jgi:hypothetical protein
MQADPCAIANCGERPQMRALRDRSASKKARAIKI